MSFTLSVANKHLMLSAIMLSAGMLSVIMLNVVAPTHILLGLIFVGKARSKLSYWSSLSGSTLAGSSFAFKN
jgi:hypothetical protein